MNILKIFAQPSIDEVVARRLAKARLDLLAAQDGVEYAAAQVAYHEATIKRLESRTSKLQVTTSHKCGVTPTKYQQVEEILEEK